MNITYEVNEKLTEEFGAKSLSKKMVYDFNRDLYYDTYGERIEPFRTVVISDSSIHEETLVFAVRSGKIDFLEVAGVPRFLFGDEENEKFDDEYFLEALVRANK